jgi:hypothetical protein
MIEDTFAALHGESAEFARDDRPILSRSFRHGTK